MVSVTFSCDGSHYMPHVEFLMKGNSFWFGLSNETCDPRIRVVRVDPGRGGAAAKNRGIAKACGDFVAYLDDDDLYAPTYLESALNVFDDDPTVDIVYMGVAWFGKKGEWGQDNYNRAWSAFWQSQGEYEKAT